MYKYPVVTFERPELSPGLIQLKERFMAEDSGLTVENAMNIRVIRKRW
jgi:hypothetical protein